MKKKILVFGLILIVIGSVIAGSFIFRRDGFFMVDSAYIYGQRLFLEASSNNINTKNIKDIKLYYNGSEYNIDYSILPKNQIIFATFTDKEYFLLDDVDKSMPLYIEIIFKGDRKHTYRIFSEEEENLVYYPLKSDKKVTLKLKNMEFVINDSNDYVYDIVIDPGHSLEEGSKEKDKIKEYVYVLDVSLKLKEILEENGYKVAITRFDEHSPNNDVDPYGENNRVSFAYTTKAKYLFSIHTNFTEYDMKYGGVEIYTTSFNDLKLASSLADSIVSITGTTYSGKKESKISEGVYIRNFTQKEIENSKYDINEYTPYYYMLRETGGKITNAYVDGSNKDYKENIYRDSKIGCESYIIEMGYLTYKDDYKNLFNNEELYANAIAEGIINYLNN